MKDLHELSLPGPQYSKGDATERSNHRNIYDIDDFTDILSLNSTESTKTYGAKKGFKIYSKEH